MLSNLKKIILDRPGLDKNIKRIIILESIDSTNLYAKSLQNPLDSTIVIASNQIKGRGRKNREWKSFGHKNVAISIILNYPKDNEHMGLLSILSSNSIVQALKSYNIHGKVKWPNDVLVNSKKISGVLSEAVFKKNKSKSIVIGVGINVNCNKHDFHIDNFQYRLEPTSVFIESGDIVSREDLIASFLDFFYFWISEFKSKNYKRIVDFWKSNWEDIGADVSFVHEGEEISGKIIDINQKGELILEVSNQLKIISSGEIIV